MLLPVTLKTPVNVNCQFCGHDATEEVEFEFTTGDEAYKIGCKRCRRVFGELIYLKYDQVVTYRPYF